MNKLAVDRDLNLVCRWPLNRAFLRKEIQEVIDGSSLDGLIFGDDFIEAYYVEDAKDETEKKQFNSNIEKATNGLGRSVDSVTRQVARRWV